MRRVLPLLLIGLAAALRLHNLGWNSVDADEAFSWAVANKPLLQLLSDAFHLRGDPHPFVYGTALKASMALMGASEAALRLPSALAGVALVALVYKSGRQLFSREAGLAAGLFAALGAFWIWNSQDARMYTLGAALALAGLVCLVNGLRDGEVRWWAGYFCFTTLACYTHITGAFLLPFEGLLILVNATRFRRMWRRALLVLTVIGLAYLPYAWNAWQASKVPSPTRHTPGYGELLSDTTLHLSLDQGSLPPTGQWAALAFIGAVFILGLAVGREARSTPPRFGRVFVLLFYFTPLAAISILSLRQSVYEPKGLMFFGTALALGVGAGWARVWEWHRTTGVIVGLGLVGLQAYGIGHLWRPGYQKEDWRHAVAYVAQHIGPNDVIVVHLEAYRAPFTYYFRGPNPVVTPFGSNIHDLDEVGRGLQPLTHSDTIWLVQSGEFLTDPNHLVQNWLTTRYPLATEQFPRSVSVRQFVVHPQLPALPAGASPLDITFGGRVHLAGYELDAQRLKATEIWLHPPSNWIHVRLYWSLTQPLRDEPTVQVTLEDEPGNVWGSSLERPGGVRTFFPMTTWTPGLMMRDELDLNLNPATLPGQYKLVIRLLTANGAALPITFPDTGEGYLILQSIEVLP